MRYLSLFIPLLFSACGGIVVSDKPLSAARYADRDTRLEGLWRTDDGMYLYVVYGPGAHGSILFFGRDDKKGIGTMYWDFFVTRTSKHAYLNFAPIDTVSRKQLHNNKGKAYLIAEYHFSWFAQLSVSFVGGEALSKAVEQRRLHGKNEFLTTTISLENPSRVLVLIESSNPKDVFMKPTQVRRIGRP